MKTNAITPAIDCPFLVYLPGTEQGYKNPAVSLEVAQIMAQEMKSYSGVTPVIETSDGQVLQGNPALHTAGPWPKPRMTSNGDVIYIPDSTRNWDIATVNVKHSPHGQAEANAARIVAAVNACEGIPTEVLESGIIREMIDELSALRQLYQRDNIHENRFSKPQFHGVKVSITYKMFERIDTILLKILRR